MSALLDSLRTFFRTFTRTVLPDGPNIRAGVLVLIFEKTGEPHFLLTRRTKDVEHHKGQISFPGGAVDAGDRDLVATALRESNEEVGLPTRGIEILGLGDDISVPSGFIITPVVGYIKHLPLLKMNTSEVESVIEVPLSFFAEPANKRVVKMMRNGELRDVYFYNYGETEIWGATAAIIESFLRKTQAAT